jgi:hypothetical protein
MLSLRSPRLVLLVYRKFKRQQNQEIREFRQEEASCSKSWFFSG